MPSVKARFTTAGLLLSLSAPMMGCGGLPPVRPAPASLTVLLDPNVSVGEVRNEKGLEIKPMVQDALAKGLTEAGYRVVTDGSADLTLHVTLAKVGYAKYGTAEQVWAEGIALDVSGGNLALAHEKRPTVNWSDYEGGNTAERLAFTARLLVNRMSTDKKIVSYATSHAGTAPTAVVVLPVVTPSPAASPSPAAPVAPGASAPAAAAPTPAPTTGGYVPTPIPAATP